MQVKRQQLVSVRGLFPFHVEETEVQRDEIGLAWGHTDEEQQGDFTPSPQLPMYTPEEHQTH